ncbi:Asp23/Gls24 family envelope stress response protein [Arthrobacter sp. JSM 101049]|uniref:Asp23/Gls24 family envelope stress response protein n=1 Tax=Arthrobacter sp. JSM 101049 TaxID=929097 RepID=UPI0035613710
MDQPEHLPAQPVSTPATGTTSITDSAVAKVAAVAARSVPGVHFLGLGSSRALGALRGAVGAGEGSPGVSAEVGQREVAVDIVLTAAYGRPLQQIAEEVRAAVYLAVERITGLHVIEVNVEIGDVHLPEAAGAAPHAAAGQQPPQPPDRTPRPHPAAPNGGATSDTVEQP